MTRQAKKSGKAGRRTPANTTTGKNGCSELTAAGFPCKSPALKGKAFCWFHDPERRAERIAANVAGGKARHGRQLGSATRPPLTAPDMVKLDTLQDLKALIVHTITDVMGMERSFNKARVLNGLYTTARNVIVDSDIEREVAELREMVERLLEGQK